MITIARVDERLIHGQVAYAWTVEYKSQAVMAVDDEVAKDSFQKTLLEMACPAEMKCFVVGKEKAIELLKKYESRKIFVVAKDPAVLLYLVENGISIPSINVGGLYYKEGRKQISKTIYLDEALTEVFKKLHNLGVQLETRTTPRDAKNGFNDNDLKRKENRMETLILSLFIALLITENYGYGYWMVSRPIFAGPLIGLLMGDMTTGLIVGGSVELMYMGILPIGGSVPPNAQIAGILSTVFAIYNGGNPEVGIALALPIGLLAQLLIMFAWNINILLMHVADKHIEEGNVKKVELTHLAGLVVFFITFFIPTYLAIHFGSDFVNSVVEAMPPLLTDGLKVASGILPAVGMAMLLKMMNLKKYWPFFLAGFVGAVYLGMDVLGVALIGFAIAASLYLMRNDKKEDDGFEEEEMSVEAENGILTNKELWATFRRSFFSMTTINYERYCSLGFCYAMIPALKKLYPNEADFKEALKRHNEFFNCHPYTGNAVLGVTLALEEQRAMGKQITAEAISSTKAALMGSLSGIGDSIFKASFMTIFAAIAAGLALDGNAIAPVVFIVPNVALNVLSRWYFIKYGHKLGTSLVSKMKNSDLIDRFVEGATIVGMMVVAAMTVSFVKLNVAYIWTFGEKEIIVQDLLNAIFPCLLPILLVLAYYKILNKSNKGMYICVIVSFVIGIVGKAIGMF